MTAIEPTRLPDPLLAPPGIPHSRNGLLPENLRSGLDAGRIPGPDGLRAVGSFLVIFYHLGYEFLPGGQALLMFFVLSGFLITWLLLKENEKSGTVSLRNFYIRRSLRIFPAFYFYWILYVALAIALHKLIIRNQAIAAFFYFNNYFQATHRVPATGLSDTWSLAVEEQFYLIWPPLFFLLRKRTARQVWVLVGLVGFIEVYRELMQFKFKVWEGYIYMAFDTRADHLLIGCLLAILLRYGYLAGLWRGICRRPALSVITLSLMGVSVVLQNRYGTTYRNSVAFVVDPFLVVVLLIQVIAFREAFLFRWLEHPWVRYIGRTSYSTYLYQGLVRYSVMKRVAGLPLIVQWASVIGVILLLASASYFLIELPFWGLRDRTRKLPQARA
jgi:peptidoglycan/LPS O-acetylase OafA/YrhL